MIDRVIFLPGFLESKRAFFPLTRVLGRRCADVACFPDRPVFRNLDRSVERLAEMIQGGQSRSTAIVTHSFGDWIARKAIAQSSNHNVNAFVSVTPVMRPGLMPWIPYLVSGTLIPEIKIIMDRQRAAEDLNCDERIQRLVFWAKADAYVREVPLDDVPNLQVQHIAATHLSIIVQPHVLKTIESFLFDECSL